MSFVSNKNVENNINLTEAQTLTNKTLDADNNTIENLETDNLKAGVLETDLNNAVDDTNIPSAKASKDYTDAHTSLDSGVHGVSGDVVGTTDAQTLTNKSIQDPTRLDVKKDTLANLETYAATATNGQFVFATDTKQMLQIVDNALVPVGSGSGGGIDVFFTERFEETVAADLSSGNNATFLGGGSLAGSLADDESTPIAGDRSITYTQASGSADDYVALPNIELALKEQDNVCGLKVYTIYDGNDSEIDFVVWDVTNSVELARVPIKASTKALEHQAIFETADDTVNITCGFQVILENSGAVLEFDEIEAKVNPFETTDIYASSEWEDAELTTSDFTGLGTVTNLSSKYRREGQEMVVDVTFSVGTPTGDAASIRVPFNKIIDPQSLTRNTTTAQWSEKVGDYLQGASGGGRHGWILAATNTSADRVYFSLLDGSVGDHTVPQGGSAFSTGSENMAVSFRVPIAGWSNVRQGVTVKNTTSTDIASENVFSARIDSAGNIADTNLDWIDSVTVNATGDYTITFKTGIFSNTPAAIAQTTQNVRSIPITSIDSTQLRVTANNEGSAANSNFDIFVSKQGDDFVKERDRVYTVPVGFKESEHYLSDFDSNFWDATGQILTWDSSLIKDAVKLSNSPNIEISNGTTPDGTATRIVAKQPIDLAISAMGNVVVGNGVFIKNSSGENLTYSIRNDGSNNYTTDTVVTKLNTGDYIYLRNTNAASREGLVTIWTKPSKEDGLWVGKFGYETAYIKDVKSSGTNGGTFTSGAWQTRDLNDLSGDTSFVSLSSNQFTLEAGIYDIECTAPVFGSANSHKAKLRNITDSTDAIIGTTQRCGAADDNNNSIVKGRLVLSSSKTFELQHQAQTTVSTTGFGSASGFGVDEIYSQVKIVKKR